jgi:hypothetical protein
MDEASQALTRVEPIKFRAARGYMTEWKKLQSASKLQKPASKLQKPASKE